VSYFLVIYYFSDNSNYSGIITVISNRLEDIGIIFCIFLLLDKRVLDMLLLNIIGDLEYLFIIFIVLAAFTKRAQFPFRAWLPLAIAAPTPISALVHSSTLVTAGVYLLIRFSRIFKISIKTVRFFLVLVIFTLFISGTSALVDVDIKKVIAYSTLSQLSIIILVLFLGNEVMRFFHILTHALFKALLFLCSGIFIHESLNNQDLRNFGEVYYLNLIRVSVFFVCSLSLIGFPFFKGILF